MGEDFEINFIGNAKPGKVLNKREVIKAVLQAVLKDSHCQRGCVLSDLGPASNALRNSHEILGSYLVPKALTYKWRQSKGKDKFLSLLFSLYFRHGLVK